MKKSLLALILAVALVAPVFAQKGDKSINAKLGLGVNNDLSINYDDVPDGMGWSIKTKIPAISLGAEFFYGLMDNLSVGAGISYGFKATSKEIEGEKPEVGVTNFYVAVKPEAKIESDIFTSIYLIGQIGGSSVSMEAAGESRTADMGIYLGFGAGTTIKENFIVELLYAFNYGTVDMKGEVSGIDATYKTLKLKVGYKFAI
jgi:long-subunit fatty acid transport protein